MRRRVLLQLLLSGCLGAFNGVLASFRQKRQEVVEQPRIVTQDGHLIFQTGENHNITFSTTNGGSVNIDGESVRSIAQNARTVKQDFDSFKVTTASRLTTVETSFNNFQSTTSGTLTQLGSRLSTAENTLSDVNSRTASFPTRVGALEQQIATVASKLQFDDCGSSPCRNGGSCFDMYDGYRCLCPANWQGPTCSVDVNECQIFQGTLQGCDHGACINTVGGFTCNCTQGYVGVLCNFQRGTCSSASSQSLCGHGTCVDQPGDGSFTCLCDEGWSKDSSTPGKCVVDKNECITPGSAPCYPGVVCTNIPGSYVCGSCPPGYAGNGYSCSDVNECLTSNGGCSLVPLVDCVNTVGSRTCGPCPSGYQGNGVVCIWVGFCQLGNGGCSPNAECVDYPGAPSPTCICRPGYTGVGRGTNGCVATGVNPGSCTPNPCVHGTCLINPNSNSFVCTCSSGFTGTRCEVDINECQSSPCRNQGTCNNFDGGYSCTCSVWFTGPSCEVSISTCGGTFNSESGNFSFPTVPGFPYPPNFSCAWVVTTTLNKVLMVSFPQFRLEAHPSCDYDFLQIHDGSSASAQLLGKYCGTTAPAPFNSTHNQLYFWFHSDSSVNTDGFSVQWTSVTPSCGGDIRNRTYGNIVSPGYPGKYPINRSCIWTISTTPGYNILFTFGHLALEQHPTCAYDYLEVRNGLRADGQLLQRYCSSGDPAPLTTQGSEAFLKFVSDASLTDDGFQINWSVARADCGGVYNQDSGVIISPNYPNHYDHNNDCIYLITVAANQAITLTFTNMDMEVSDTCRYDWVEVRDGESELSPLMGRYCGTAIPPVLVSTTNKMYVKFHSDISVRGTGFRATWTVACGGTYTAPTGQLVSPYYPYPYPSEKDCYYLISQPQGLLITLSFSFFDIEASGSNSGCIYDYLEVRNGATADAPLLGRYCGAIAPAPISSTGNTMWLRFHTDASVTNLGFVASYSTQPGGGTDPGASCGGILTDAVGTITSPGHPNNYPHGVTCRWDVRVQSGFQIRLSFNFFSLEANQNCLYDYLEIYDNSTSTSSGGFRGRYCGPSLPPTITSAENVLTLIFVADASIASEGFSATYISLNYSYCGSELTGFPGLISSPNYPADYPHNRECIWTIVAPSNHQIKLNATDFQLESHADCLYDFLEIRNGGFASSPLIGTYCGTRIVSPIVSSSNRLWLRFKSDISMSAKGFQMWYEDIGEGCGADFDSPSGSILSPNYPSPYGHNAECYWTITVARGSLVTIIFTDMQIENHDQCVYDYIEIIDGLHVGPSLGRFCGSALPQPIRSTSNFLSVKFRTDISDSGRGFSLSYSASCQNVQLTGSAGVIESPNFPNPYPHSRDCSWLVTATLGNTINASFSHFDVEDDSNCRFDYLQLNDGQAVDAPLIGKYCGTSLPPPIATNTSYLAVKFRSDASLASNGFRMEWFLNGCGRDFNSPTGSFSSPNYPQPYPVRRECVWRITVPIGSYIELTIPDLQLEAQPNCLYDVLEVYGGRDTTSPRLAQICQTQSSPQTITNTGNQMYVRFKSDVSNTGRGFTANYRSLSGGCGGNLTTSSGTIVSKDYPSTYPHNTECVWNIIVAPDRTVSLQFTDFDIETSSDCTYDYVAVYDGLEDNAPQLLKWCGSSLPNVSVVTSSGNTMRIRMFTDASLTGRGFMANYKTSCGGYVNADQPGEIASPNYPNPYDPLVNCSWIITTSRPADRITLIFTHMDLEDAANCRHDSVRVLQGNNIDSPEQGRYCGVSIPPSITSLGNSLVVQFTSDASIQQSGFRLAYSKSLSFCGGNFTAERGAFNSPGYPGSYANNIECIWTLNTSPGNRMMLTFSYFNLQSSSQCGYDYVEVRDGGDLGRFLGRFCGTSIPANVTVGHSLWVKFRTDSLIAGGGFMAQFSMLHGGELTGSSGQVASPLYPRQYPHNADYNWLITVDAGMKVKVTFVTLDMETGTSGCIYDYIRFYDGNTATSAVIGSYCGTRPPAPFTSTGNQMFAVFHSDFSSNGQGFLFSWEATGNVITTPGPPGPTTASLCGGQLVASTGLQLFNSPNYPSNYPNNVNCAWQISSPEGTKIALNFTDMNLEPGSACYYDKVEVYSGNGGTGSQLLGRFCGRVGNAGLLLSTSNLMTVKFVTDYSLVYSGFQASYVQACGGVFTSAAGVVQSPGYPGNYQNNANCSWIIQVANGRTIDFSFDFFGLQDSVNCTLDYLMLLNGNNAGSPPLGSSNSGKYCGSVNPGRMNTSSNLMYVQFFSDGSQTAQGFKLTYQEKQLDCGGRLTLTEAISQGTFMSPGYPVAYTHNIDCVWIITAPASRQVQLDFDSNFEIETHQNCDYDYVEIRDGGTSTSNSLGRFCGTERPSTIRATGNVMHVRFRTDDSVPKKGFKAVYRLATCGGTLVGSSGLITSPNYPQNYDNNLDCEWFISGPTGHYLTLTFSAFTLQQTADCLSGDYVEIQNRNRTGQNVGLLSRVCGSALPSPVDTSDSFAYVKFHTDGTMTGPGFSLRFEASVEECGGELSTPTGTFTSPNYPGVYAHDRQCYWYITVPQGRRITLVFDAFNIESQASCLYDFVEVRNGILVASPVIARYCGTTTPQITRSSGNTMTVIFSSDASISNGGFAARYSSDEEAVCGGDITSSTSGVGGVITSPGFASGARYPNRTQCVWTLQNNQQQYAGSIALLFTTLLLEPSSSCIYDRVEIREGGTSSGRVLGRYCGNTAADLPPRIVSPYNSLWIAFLTDELIEDTGFSLMYNFTRCGGLLSEASGVITSPNYPNPYNNNDDCGWEILAAEGYQITLQFTNFQVESSTNNCSDYLEVLNGGAADSPSLGRYCGSALPATIRSQTNRVRLQFYSNGNTALSGFRLTYSSQATGCGGIFQSNTGYVSSPAYPNTYPHSVECWWDISVLPGYHVELQFNGYFDIELSTNCLYDYVIVYDVISVNGQLTDVQLGRYCGRTPPPSTRSTSSRLKLKFRSDFWTAGNGFAANWTAGCGTTYSDDTGVVMSPGYPVAYDNNQVCEWLITADANAYVLLQFDSFVFRIEAGTSCMYDYVQVISGNSSSTGRSLGKFCGSTAPQSLASQGPMLLRFVTDAEIVDKGWKATWIKSACGGTFTAPSGIIRTPTNPVDYHNNLNCSWLITVQTTRAVQFKFTYFDVEAHPNCVFDYVEVRDGPSAASRLIGRYCGNTIPDTIRTTSNSMLVTFITDASITRGGFSGAYEAVYGELQGCGGTIRNVTSGAIRPRFTNGGLYENNLDCVWTVLVNDDKLIRVNVSGIDIENDPTCSKDFIELRDGIAADSPLGATYCGTFAGVRSFTASSNAIRIRFRSDDQVAGRGFAIDYDSVNVYCGGVLTASTSGQIAATPGYPSSGSQLPPGAVRCRWLVSVPAASSQKVRIDITDMATLPNDVSGAACRNNYVQIVDQPRIQGTIVGQDIQYCSGDSPSSFDSIGAVAMVNLVIDAGSNLPAFRGLQFNYSIASCSRTYNSDSGRVLSPGYPGNYGQNLACDILIRAPDGQKVALYFNLLAIEFHPSCNFDYLQIRDGSSISSPLLVTLCGLALPNPVFTTGNVAYLRFVTDTSVPAAGFDITYTSSLTAGCGGNLTESTGSFTSANYPQLYPGNQTCVWYIRIGSRQQVKLKFDRLDVLQSAGCAQGYVEVRNGGDESAPLVGRYCGGEKPADYAATSNRLFVKFYAGAQVLGTGFRALYMPNA